MHSFFYELMWVATCVYYSVLQSNLSENFETEVGSVKEKKKREISLINHLNEHDFFVSPALEFS